MSGRSSARRRGARGRARVVRGVAPGGAGRDGQDLCPLSPRHGVDLTRPVSPPPTEPGQPMNSGGEAVAPLRVAGEHVHGRAGRGEQHRVALPGEPGRGRDHEIHRFSVGLGDLGDRHIRGVSRRSPRRSPRGPRRAGRPRAAGPRRPRRARRTSPPLASPPAIQTIRSKAVSDAAAACGLVALESSTQVTPPTVATVAMRWASGTEACAARPARPPRRTPKERASAAAASALATLCGAAGLHVGHLGQLQGGARGGEGAIDEQVLHDAELARAGHAEGEADRRQPSVHLRVPHQALGRRVGRVVDARRDRPGVDAALGERVGVQVAVPVDVVRRDVEHRGRVRPDRGRPVQLEAGQLDGEHVVARLRHHHLEQGRPDVARGHRAQPGGGEDRGEHADGRRLAVGAGDRQPGRGALERAQPPGELDLAPDRDARRRPRRPAAGPSASSPAR